MVNEFSVRAEVARIESLEATPIRQTRLLLGLAKQIRPAMLRLGILSEHHYRIGDPLRAARFEEARVRMGVVHDEVRARATALLRKVKVPLGYGYGPRERAVPQWSTSAGTKEVA